MFDPTTSLPLEVESKNVFTAHHFMELVSIFPKNDLTSVDLYHSPCNWWLKGVDRRMSRNLIDKCEHSVQEWREEIYMLPRHWKSSPEAGWQIFSHEKYSTDSVTIKSDFYRVQDYYMWYLLCHHCLLMVKRTSQSSLNLCKGSTCWRPTVINASCLHYLYVSTICSVFFFCEWTTLFTLVFLALTLPVKPVKFCSLPPADMPIHSKNLCAFVYPWLVNTSCKL